MRKLLRAFGEIATDIGAIKAMISGLLAALSAAMMIVKELPVWSWVGVFCVTFLLVYAVASVIMRVVKVPKGLERKRKLVKESRDMMQYAEHWCRGWKIKDEDEIRKHFEISPKYQSLKQYLTGAEEDFREEAKTSDRPMMFLYLYSEIDRLERNWGLLE